MDMTDESMDQVDQRRLLVEIRDLLVRMNGHLERLVNQTGGVPGPTAHRAATDWESMPTEQLVREFESEKTQGRFYETLDLRRELIARLSEEDRRQLDRELAGWLTEHFHRSLRSGHAAVVAGAMERAVREIGDIPEMRPLADSLPVILRSVGLYEQMKQELAEGDG